MNRKEVEKWLSALIKRAEHFDRIHEFDEMFVSPIVDKWDDAKKIYLCGTRRAAEIIGAELQESKSETAENTGDRVCFSFRGYVFCEIENLRKVES